MNMKKIWIMLFIFVFLLCGQKQPRFSLLQYFEGDYLAYTTTADIDSTNLGICFQTPNTKATNKIGESITIQNFEPANAITTLQAKVVKTEYLSTGATIIYAYSSLVPNSVTVDGKQVNLQIAYYETHTIIGWPLIVGSF